MKTHHTTDPSEWLDLHTAVVCARHVGRWARVRCHDLSTTSRLCDKCPHRPRKPRPSEAGRALLKRLELHTAFRSGWVRHEKDGRKQNTMERVNPWMDG
jgi:hypothetical protein